MQDLPTIALVGRPNVGKSSLFNRLVKKRHAVISDVPGTTRDRLERPINVLGKAALLVDMAGIEPALKEKNEISAGMQAQVEKALASAAVVLWVVDAQTGVTTQDELVAELLRRLHKPVIVVANKTDNPDMQAMQYEFARFGFEMVPVSAIHGSGITELIQKIAPVLPERTEPKQLQEEESRELNLAILGRPNVGKSTLLNALTQDNRAVVSPIAGTTRDAVDTVLPAERIFGRTFTRWQTVRIIDTAGIRRRGKIEKGKQGIEGFSVIRSLETLDAAHLALFLIDGDEKLVHQDLQVVQKIIDAGRPLVIVVNKWDAVLAKTGIIPGTAEDDEAQVSFLERLRRQASFLYWAPVVFVSAKEGINLENLGKVLNNCFIAWSITPDNEELKAVSKHVRTLPRMGSVLGITLEHSQPPTFHIHTQGKELLHFSLRRQIEGILREYFEIGPTPIKLWVARTPGSTIPEKK